VEFVQGSEPFLSELHLYYFLLAF